MIVLKSPAEIEKIRAAGRVVAQAHEIVRRMLEPGVSTAEIDRAVAVHFQASHAVPLFLGYPGDVPFPAVTCISVNEQLAHGIPGDRKLQRGDIVTVDTGCRLDGWCADAAWTYPVGAVDELKRRLMDVGRGALKLAVLEMGRRQHWSQVARRMAREVRRAGFTFVEDFVGHGIGRELHEDPQVPNVFNRAVQQDDFPLSPGLVLAIEPMVTSGTKHVVVCDDQWTVETEDLSPSVHFEHTVAMTSDGVVVLTEGLEASHSLCP